MFRSLTNGEHKSILWSNNISQIMLYMKLKEKYEKAKITSLIFYLFIYFFLYRHVKKKKNWEKKLSNNF